MAGTDTPYNLGWNASYDGESSSQNPYQEDSKEFDEWRRGYFAAETQQEDEDEDKDE